MKNLLLRTATGAVYVGIILASLLTHAAVFAVVSTLLVFLAVKELDRLFRINSAPGFWLYLSCILFLLSVIITCFIYNNPVSLVLLLAIPVTSQIGSLFMDSKKTMNFLAFVSLALIYIMLPLYLLNRIHNYSIAAGIPFTLAIFILIWTNDTFAYITGMAFGRHKFVERISPKKTWEGVIGGAVMTGLVSYLLYLPYPSLGLLQWLVFGLLTCIAAVFGDLIESMLKRSVNVKDSGNLLPGHGGILDRIDSLLLVSPVIYCYIFWIIN